MKRLLCIVGNMDAGGAETFLMKIYRNMDRTKYQMDFCVAKEEKGFYEDEIQGLGGRIYRITPKSKGIIKNFSDIKKLVKENEYKYVLRISQHSLSALELFAAKLGGAKKVIFRSSNTNTGGSKINQLLHYMFRFLPIIISNVKIAPSTEAAIFMFGKNAVKKKKVIILHNAIPFEKYKFSKEIREQKRKKLGLQENLVIGHVGRLTKQKNHEYLLRIFKKVKEEKKNVVLLLIGKGELENELKNTVKELKIENDVKFLGVRDDVPELMMAMDVFVFPSLYEGLPNTVVEAQATDLKCVISDKITRETNITGKVEFLSIKEEDINAWKNMVLDCTNKYERKNNYNILKENKYVIEDVVQIFVESIYN